MVRKKTKMPQEQTLQGAGSSGRIRTGEKFNKGLQVFLEWIHIGLLFATFYPVAYMILMDRDDRLILPIFLAGFVILLPAAGARIAIRFVKSFFLYALVCALLCVLTFQVSGWIGRAFGFTAEIMTGYRISVLIQTILVMIESIYVRLRENSRARALKENDYTWTDREFLLERPIYPMLVWYVVLYLISRNFDCRTGCDIAVVCFLLYAAAACLHRHLADTERYIGLLSYVKQLPVRRIRMIGTGFVLTFLLTAGISAALPAAATAGIRTYRDLRKWAAERDQKEEIDWEGDPLELRYNEDPFDELFRGQRMPRVPEWVDQLVRALGMVFLAGAGVVVLRIFWRFLADFRDTQEENGDISVSLDEDVIEKIAKPARAKRFAGDERERIRRRYRREIRRRRKERPAPSETPTQIETAAGLAGTAEGQELHVLYEKARYG